MSIAPGTSSESSIVHPRDVSVADVLNLETPRLMSGISPSSAFFTNAFLSAGTVFGYKEFNFYSQNVYSYLRFQITVLAVG